MSSFASTSASRRCEELSNGNSCAVCRWSLRLKEGTQEVANYGLRLIIHAAPSTDMIRKHGLHSLIGRVKDEELQLKFFEMEEKVADREAWGKKLLAAEQRRIRTLKAEKAERAARARREREEQEERERQQQEQEQEEEEEQEEGEQENEAPAASTPSISQRRAVLAPMDWAPRRASLGAGTSRKKLMKARRTSMKVQKELAGEPSEPRRQSTRARRSTTIYDPSN